MERPPIAGSGLVGPDGEPIRSAPRANRLAAETSPYLLQHAHNPVDWYPWGPEAFERARREDKPIFLSIGYAACHWCHVMERESFENETIAQLMNQEFVNVKVDREERPDVDDIYMASVQMISGQGGWPMSVFLTPDLRPFYAGTYFPPEDRYGRPGFPRLLAALAQAYRERREEVEAGASQIVRHLEAMSRTPAGDESEAREESAAGEGSLTMDLVRRAVHELQASFDPRNGGFGAAPKFPHAMALQLLLRHHQREGSSGQHREGLPMVTTTLDHMAAGGIYDHLGGGFHRYSVTEDWLVPHFEKMLYDQALLVSAYVEGWQVTGDPSYGRVIRETIEYVLRDLGDPNGAFYSSEDADSEGEEGKFYVWTLEEAAAILTEEELSLFARAYDLDEVGNFEGSTILERRLTPATLVERGYGAGRSEREVADLLERARAKLLEARSRRIRPARDEKILTAWNAWMISALARAGRSLDEPRFREAAVRAGEFLWDTMRIDGVVHRVHKDGRTRIAGYLEDYAGFVQAAIDLYEATFDARWLERAVELAESMRGEFEDESDGGFHLTSDRHDGLIVRLKTAQDSSTPSGNSMAATALLRLASLTGRADFETSAHRTLLAFRDPMEQVPAAFHQMLLALDHWLGPRAEVVLAGSLESEQGRALRNTVDRAFLPRSVVAYAGAEVAQRDRADHAVAAGSAGGAARRADSTSTDPTALAPELLAGKAPVGGMPAVYVCRDFTCDAPCTDAEELRRILERGPA